LDEYTFIERCPNCQIHYRFRTDMLLDYFTCTDMLQTDLIAFRVSEIDSDAISYQSI